MDGWLAAVRADCDRVDGFLECVVSAHADERLELAVAVSFTGEEQLSAWLDGPAWAALLAHGTAVGIRRASSDLVIVDDEPAPPGSASSGTACSPVGSTSSPPRRRPWST